MPTTAFETVLTTIANAIRTKTPALGSGLIPVTDFADRIKLIPRADDVGKVAVYATEQTQAFMNTNKLVRLNGWPAFETPSSGTVGASAAIYNKFRREEWQGIDYPPNLQTLPNLMYRAMVVVGDKIYMGFSTGGGTGGSTELQVINWRTGALTKITGLTSRSYNGIYVVGTRLYLFCGRHVGTIPSYNTVYCINTTNDTIEATITLGASRQYVYAELVGNRLYFAWEGSTAATDIPYINTSDNSTGMTTGLVSRVQHGLYSIGNKLYVMGNAASDSINVITGSGGTAPNYTTWAVSNITGLPNKIWSNNWSNFAHWKRAGNYLYVGSSDAGTEILKIDTASSTNATTQITGLANVQHRPFELVGTKLYIGSNVATTQMTVITSATSAAHAVKQITLTGATSKPYTVFQTVGTKLYAGTNTINVGGTLLVINTTNDSFSELVLGNTTTSMGWFVLDGTNLYIFNNWSFDTSSTVLNTTNDTVRARVTYPQGAYDILVRVDASRANPTGGLYLAKGGSSTVLVEVDFATIDGVPSGTAVPARQITGLPSKSYGGAQRVGSCTIFAGEKLWLSDSGNASTTITCLSKSMLPNHVNTANNTAPFVYVRY